MPSPADRKPLIHAFFDNATNTVSYLVADPVTREAAVIDPVLQKAPGLSSSESRKSTRSACCLGV
jgi:hypothetical protein